MGKKSRCSSVGSASNGSRASDITSSDANANHQSAVNEDREASWRRLKRSLIAVLVIGAFSIFDVLTLKEGVTVVMPDNMPLLAVVALFGWFLWKRWASSGKLGLHPLFRTLGFMASLAGCLAILPFNSTVTMLEAPFLTLDECQAVAKATAELVSVPGFVPTFSVFDPSTEVPLQDLPVEIFNMVSVALRKQLMPYVSSEYHSQGEVTLDDRLYVEHYQAYHEAAPLTHVRHGQLSFRVELDPPDSKYVGGGGVFLVPMGKTITPGTGSGLVLPAKLRHGSSLVGGPNTRSVLVGSMTVRGRNPWQRFVGIWRLWGLLSRNIRYMANRGLISSGVDNIPAPDFEPEEAVVGEADGHADGLGSGNNEKLEF